jgi:uncharacterized glyoxalase superfamily protein PhnB
MGLGLQGRAMAHLRDSSGKVGNVGESMDGWPAHGLVAQIYVEDSDQLFKRAVDAGATEIMPMTDMFFGCVKDGSRILTATCGPLRR